MTARSRLPRGDLTPIASPLPEAGIVISAHQRAQFLALIHAQAPDQFDELSAYVEDPVLFTALALSLHNDGVVNLPDDLLRRLQADLGGLDFHAGP